MLGGLLLATAGLLGFAGPAAASCALPPAASPYAFTGTVTAVDDGGRVATVQTESGRVVTVLGTPEVSSAATSVDRFYVVGARYRFHPLNGDSPYRDNACTATTRLDADASPPAGTPGAGASPRPGPAVWWPVAAAGAGVAAVLIPLVIRRRRHATGMASSADGA
jgi:hypothetical protein